jgi:hypothetical protein
MTQERFPMWQRAQREVERHAREALLPPNVLRTTTFLRPDMAEQIADWYLGTPTEGVQRSYRALERETARLFDRIRRLGVRVRYVDSDPYENAAELCAELREERTMMLTTIACEETPHPLLGSEEGGAVDQLRVVHDVFGHAALGLGFDLQSEFATWLQCRTLFSGEARPAAFCELVGAVTAYITTGAKPGLRAQLPTRELMAACEPEYRWPWFHGELSGPIGAAGSPRGMRGLGARAGAFAAR